MSAVVATPEAMKLNVEVKLARSKFETPKMPWPLVQPPARRVPKPMKSPPTNIQITLPVGPHPKLASKRPRSQIGVQPWAIRAESKPPHKRPAKSGKRHERLPITSVRRRYGALETSEQMSSKPVEIPRR